MDRLTLGIVIFDEVEVLDYCGPFEVFSTVRLDEATRRDSLSPFDVRLIAEKPGPVTTSGGMRVWPDHALADCPRLDIVLVPGGWGTRRELENPVLLAWIRERAAEVRLLASVCTGSLLLGKAGLLAGKRATTHWKLLAWMAGLFPETEVVRDRHFVRDGSLWTSAGISAGIDMSLAIVADLLGEPLARATARHMEYAYPESDARRIELE
ncbi:DJ-1/PfpI family protein [Ruficoccus amylovorans]|uniref:DJ-1/PfpI family protein n=1 Tax=Ruficoccus amylovorans TaxID=1804625 RepID=A0A842HHH1_9BACT|nr:DJ-1/PfpI family protein [Ruficoccus amylovorans]MBC2596185.1 DJ-1/PfpI family protein [Ruficoccus amylovorans]